MRSALQAAIAALGDIRPAAAADGVCGSDGSGRLVGDDTTPCNRIQSPSINSRLFNMRRFIAASAGCLAALFRGRFLE